MIPENRESSETIIGGWINPPQTLEWNSFHWGPVHPNDPSQGLFVQLWTARAEENEILLSAPNYPESVLLARSSEVKQVSLAFDQNGQPCVAFVEESGAAFMYWYDPTIPGFDLMALAGETITPRVTLDDARGMQLGSNDIILMYVRSGSLYFRQQRDRFEVEYLLQTGAERLYHVSMNSVLRLQWLYKGPGMPAPPFLADVVQDLCVQAGIPPERIDVRELYGDIVHGLPVDSDEGLAEPIDQLRQVFSFDKAEFDGKIHFPKRGREVVARIPYTDLVRGNPVSLEQIREDESQLAREINLNHIDPDGGFAKNKQFAQRRSNLIHAEKKTNIDTQIVLTVDQAATAAETLLRIDWNELVEYKFSTTIKWAELTVADVVEVEDHRGTWHRMRLEERNEDGHNIEWEAKQDAGVRTYGTVRGGHSIPPPTGTTPGLVSSTQFEVIDISPLRDQDDELGLYVAAAGQPGMTWVGYELMVSVDGGATYGSALRSELPATIGESVTDLPAEPGHDIVSAEVVEVTTNFPLVSVDSAQLATGQNRCVIGGEVFQFETATLIGMAGPLYHYELSGLHRAKYGTLAPLWPAGTRFVLLDEGVTFIRAERNMIGLDLHYKPVSIGQSEDETTATAYLFDEPSSQTEWPVENVQAVRDPLTDDVAVTWAGRPRLGQFGTPYHSKYFRGYRVEFSDSHVIETMSETATYSAAPVGVSVTVAAVNAITGPGPESDPVAT